MSTTDLIISHIGVAACGLLLGGFIATAYAEFRRVSEGATTVSEEPRIVVNVPADYKPLQTLDGQEVVIGEKAVLWWTVFNKTINTDYETASDAVDAANAAVDKVYGES